MESKRPIFSTYMALVAVCAGFFMVIMNILIVNVALPAIAENIGATFSELQWIAAGYSFAFASFLLSAGYCTDRFGAKRVFIWGLSVCVFTSLGGALAWTALVLVIFRVLQGAAAAFVVPTGLALLNRLYEDRKARAKAVGIWSSMGVLASACSLPLGGMLTSLWGWSAVFLINIPIGLLTLFLALYFLPEERHGSLLQEVAKKLQKIKVQFWRRVSPPQDVSSVLAHPSTTTHQRSFDLPGQILGILSIAALSFSLIEAGRFGLSSPLILSGFALFITAFLLFLYREHHASAPMFPLSFFKHPVSSASMGIAMLLNIGGDGFLFILPLYLQQVRDYSAGMAGLALIPFVGLAIVGSYVGGRMASARGVRLPIVMGTLLGAAGFLGMLVAGEHSPSYGFFVLPLMAIGLGCSVTVPAITIAVLHTVPIDKVGTASGILGTGQQAANLLGIAAFGTIVHTATYFVAGMHMCLIIAASLFLGASVLAYLGMKK